MKRHKIRRVVQVEDGVVKSRYVRRGSEMRYDPVLQEILDLEGQAALEQAAVKWTHGLVKKRR